MKTLKLFALATFAFLFSQCKTTAPTDSAATAGHLYEVPQLLDTLQGKFYELAKSHRSSTPQQVLLMAADWVKTQPNVEKATWFDSTYIDIKMKSGLRTLFVISLVDTSGKPLTRGGNSDKPIALKKNKGTFAPLVKATNEITNKKVLLFEPFSGCGRQDDFYSQTELDAFMTLLNNSGRKLDVNLLRCGECTIDAVQSFGNYGLVIIETHGVPDGFLTGQYLRRQSNEKTEAEIKMNVESQLGPAGYDGMLKGYFRLGAFNLVGIYNWQDYLNHTDNFNFYRVFVNSEFINSLPAMPNTIVFGNMCFSGWSLKGTFQIPKNGEYTVNMPIQGAFMDRDPICYYAYANDDGTSTSVGNLFAEHMMDTILRNLVVKADSTGDAFLSSTGNEFTGKQFYDKISPDLLFKHFGAENYSYENCVSEFTDDRDGQKYKAVCIGKQNWMAENLRYDAPGSSCYGDDPNNCVTYGRLYDWQTVMNGAASSSANPSGVQGICPKGWHLPSQGEFQELLDLLGGSAGKALKSTSGWAAGGNGTNTSGFNALPAGFKNGNGSSQIYTRADFWSTTLKIDQDVWDLDLQYFTDGGAVSYTHSVELSCRCLKN